MFICLLNNFVSVKMKEKIANFSFFPTVFGTNLMYLPTPRFAQIPYANIFF